MASNLSAYSPALSPSAPPPSPFFPPTPNPFFSAPAISPNIVLKYMFGVFGGLFLIAGVFIIDRLLRLCLGRVRRGQEDQSGFPLQSVAVIGTTRRSHFEEGVPLEILDKLTVRTYFRQHQKQQQALVSQPNTTTANSTCSNIKPSPSMELLSKRCFDDKDTVIRQDDSPAACAVTTMTSETHGDGTNGTNGNSPAELEQHRSTSSSVPITRFQTSVPLISHSTLTVGMRSGHCTFSDQSATSPAAMVTAVESEAVRSSTTEKLAHAANALSGESEVDSFATIVNRNRQQKTSHSKSCTDADADANAEVRITLDKRRDGNETDSGLQQLQAQAGAMECQAVDIEDKDSQCTVCLLDYEDGELLRQLPCKHEFHKDCIDSWMCNHKTCPICRCEVV